MRCNQALEWTFYNAETAQCALANDVGSMKMCKWHEIQSSCRMPCLRFMSMKISRWKLKAYQVSNWKDSVQFSKHAARRRLLPLSSAVKKLHQSPLHTCGQISCGSDQWSYWNLCLLLICRCAAASILQSLKKITLLWHKFKKSNNNNKTQYDSCVRYEPGLTVQYHLGLL